MSITLNINTEQYNRERPVQQGTLIQGLPE